MNGVLMQIALERRKRRKKTGTINYRTFKKRNTIPCWGKKRKENLVKIDDLCSK